MIRVASAWPTSIKCRRNFGAAGCAAGNDMLARSNRIRTAETTTLRFIMALLATLLRRLVAGVGSRNRLGRGERPVQAHIWIWPPGYRSGPWDDMLPHRGVTERVSGVDESALFRVRERIQSCPNRREVFRRVGRDRKRIR